LGYFTDNLQNKQMPNNTGYIRSEAWSGVNWADLMAAQSAFGSDFYDRSTRMIVGTMLLTEYRPVIKFVPKAPWAAMRSAQFTPLQASDRVYLPTLSMYIFTEVERRPPFHLASGYVHRRSKAYWYRRAGFPNLPTLFIA